MSTGSTSRRRSSPSRGQAWQRSGQEELFFIMAVADGYVLARRKGCMPFVLSISALHVNCTRMDAFDRNMGRPS